MLSTLMCNKTAYTDVVFFITLKSYKYRPLIVQCGNMRKFIKKLSSELNVLNLGRSVFQLRILEKQNLS